MANKGVIFLTGVGRSGTTLLQSLLHAHSEINFSVETHFFKRHILPVMLGGSIPGSSVLKQDSYLKRLQAEKLQKILSVEAQSLDDLVEMFFEIMSPEGDSDCVYLGDKDTEYVRYLPHLKRLMPEAFFIHIIRDPRDVVASRLKTEWGAKRSKEFHMAEYQYYLKKVLKEGPLLFGNRYIQLKYEDLLDNPERQLTAIFGKLNLKYESQVLDFYKSGNELVAEDEKKWKENVSKPLKKGNSGNWRKSLSNKDAAALQSGLEFFFEEQGYEMVNEGSSMIQQLKIHAVRQLFAGKTFKESLR